MPEQSALTPIEPPASIPAADLYRVCEAEWLPFKSTAELEPLGRHLGQERAVDALEFGLAIPHEGYNIFVLGSSGMGKRSLLQSLLDENNAAPQGAVADWCYVNNFDAPDKPIALQLPPGKAEQLRSDMAQAVEDLLGIFPATFQSDEYQSRVQELSETYQSREQDAFQKLAEKAKAQQIAMIQTPGGYSLAPMKDGEIITPQDFEALPADEKESALQVIETLKDELKAIVRQLPGWKKESRNAFRELNQEFSRLALDPVLEELKNRYQPFPSVMNYLDAVHANMMDEAESFAQMQEDSAIPDNLKHRVKEFPQYNVNVLVDNGELPAAPVVHEDSPGFSNLIGRVEYASHMGTLVTDFNLIKPGALHKANGGYLILEAEKLLTSPYAWTTLKQALKAGEIRIQSLEQIFSFVSTVQLEPASIPLKTKVVVIGDRYIYYILQQYDPEFASLFKVAADMSEEVPRSRESTLLFARLIRTLLEEHTLLPMDAAAVARTIEHAARSMEDSEKLSLHQGRLEDLLTESDFRARKQHLDCITAEVVDEAIEAAIHRLDQFREKSHEGILRDVMLVSTDGRATGQVNGLAVYLLGEYAFGRPTRISATARLGQGKVLDIEREVDLGGHIHSKAVMIISSLLGNRYARNRPLPLAASLTFEQSYGGVDGDSASVAELAVLISAIADIPLRQDLAVTGSLNQHGQVQAIGGVNEKIEGFFDICKARGLTGAQGVIIPAANQVHLMLRRDVRDAVEAGEFHIYPVEYIDGALELLTGCTVESVDAAVGARVEELQDLARSFSDKDGRQDDK
ncbi:Lon protease family protein [Pseudohalioglobus lutimaris]|uniref:endopeptidase La n=1 Tax=Pseudohalioglobus lutimaris TaxID=1737061 RepID=A0A2N5WWR2_9GAMM|nr:ATP-binding protein [Pseudohalioglobus lutimaris]PLW66665.1 ATP-dependent protease [Pseudohalioglobus lutimaris]